MSIRWCSSCGYDDSSHLAGPWCSTEDGARAVLPSLVSAPRAAGIASSPITLDTADTQYVALVDANGILVADDFSPADLRMARQLGLQLVPLHDPDSMPDLALADYLRSLTIDPIEAAYHDV